jgi:hypothetical protein
VVANGWLPQEETSFGTLQRLRRNPTVGSGMYQEDAQIVMRHLADCLCTVLIKRDFCNDRIFSG